MYGASSVRRIVVLLAMVLICPWRHASADEGFRISSPAFRNATPIPGKYTCDRANVSPPLRWTGVPAGTKSFAVVAEHPDVPEGSAAIWVIYDLPGDSTGVPQAVPASESLPGGARQGLNELGTVGYTGPCPEPGIPHHYYFRVYALDAHMKLEPRARKADVFRAMRRYILRVAEVMATYERPAPGRKRGRRAALTGRSR